MLIDYHIHNQFSPDSEMLTSKIIETSIKNGVDEICITNHSELFSKNGNAGTIDTYELMPRFNAIKKDIELEQKKHKNIKILFGAEIAYDESWIDGLNQLINNFDFDFIIGSIHVVDNIVISSHKHAHKLYNTIPEEEAYKKYFENMYKFVEWGKFNVIGHFDINKKYGNEIYGKFEPKKYEKEIRKILKLAAQKNIGIELNTASMHNKCHELFPHPQIIKWAIEEGIDNFTLGSDAHKPEHINRHLQEALKIGKQAGIKTISTYQKGIPRKHQI